MSRPWKTYIACSRRSDSGQCREGREREKNNKVEKRERERERNACEICFQKVIPPTLSTSNPNAVSGVESCQSSNGRQNTLFTEKVCLYSSFIFVFCKPHKSLTPKMKKKKKKKKKKKNWQALLVPLSLPLIFTQEIEY